MPKASESIDTLVSVAGTMASIGLALVGILAAKSSLDHTETIADDLFLFSSLGFLLTLALGYLAQKDASDRQAARLVSLAEILFALSMLAIVLGGFLLVYTEL